MNSEPIGGYLHCWHRSRLRAKPLTSRPSRLFETKKLSNAHIDVHRTVRNPTRQPSSNVFLSSSCNIRRTDRPPRLGQVDLDEADSKTEDNHVISSNGHNRYARMDLRIRKCEPQDRKSIRDLCCDTGFLGNPIDPVFGDRDLFADILTKYYIEREPESAFIAEDRGSVVGYILGCKNSLDFQRYFILRTVLGTALKLMWRYCTRYSRKERNYARWLLFRSLRETPKIPKDSAHLHINVKQGYRTRSRDVGKKLAEKFFSYLRENKVKRVYGRVFSLEKRRKPDLFERVAQKIESQGTGFRIYDKKETTVWRDFIKGKVYLLRIVRDLD